MPQLTRHHTALNVSLQSRGLVSATLALPQLNCFSSYLADRGGVFGCLHQKKKVGGDMSKAECSNVETLKCSRSN